MPLPMRDDRRNHLYLLQSRYDEREIAFMEFLEARGIEINDDPPSEAWLLYCNALDAHAQEELFMHSIMARPGTIALYPESEGIVIIKRKEE